MVISIDAEKPYDKIQHPFMIFKTLRKVGIGTYLNMLLILNIKAVCDNMLLNGEKLNAFPLRSGKR